MGRYRAGKLQSRDLGVFNGEKKIPRMVFGIPRSIRSFRSPEQIGNR
jgi:hypothetical protein